MVCTLPKFLPLYDFYEEKFSDLCHAHDAVYVNRSGSKWVADWVMAKGVWDRGYPILAIGTYFFCVTIGWWYWIRD